MPRFVSESPARVRVGACTCPGTPHEAGDYVVLERYLSIEAGAASLAALANGTSDAAVAIAILPYMIASWDFLDAETGDPLPISPETVAEALPWNFGGREVVMALNESLERPLSSRALPKRTAKPSRTTRTASTSRKRRSLSTVPTPSE